MFYGFGIYHLRSTFQLPGFKNQIIGNLGREMERAVLMRERIGRAISQSFVQYKNDIKSDIWINI